MPHSKGVNLIDGLASVRALRRGSDAAPPNQTKPSPRPAPETAGPKPEPTPRGTRFAKRIGHTIVPDRFEIECYECGYLFRITGHLQDTTCPKCHKLLQITNEKIEGEWTKDVKTMGTVDILAGAHVGEVEIKARHAILAGDASRATIRVQESLEIRKGAQFDELKISTRDLIVRKGSQVRLTRKMMCRNVNIEGSVHAALYADGTVTISPDGFLQGEIHAPHLVMHDGAGLKAKVVLGIGR